MLVYKAIYIKKNLDRFIVVFCKSKKYQDSYLKMEINEKGLELTSVKIKLTTEIRRKMFEIRPEMGTRPEENSNCC